MIFDKWIDTLIEEKGIDTIATVYEIESELSGLNLVPLAVVVESLKTLPSDLKAKIKDTLVKIDFRNGDVHHYFKHLAQGNVMSRDRAFYGN
jgi:hypothetical protein